MRQSILQGGQLKECFAVLEKGKIDIYKSENVIIFIYYIVMIKL
jgi:hypothetical protein